MAILCLNWRIRKWNFFMKPGSSVFRTVFLWFERVDKNISGQLSHSEISFTSSDQIRETRSMKDIFLVNLI